MKKYRGIIVCGNTGEGKSTVLKALLKKIKGSKLVFDINNEHEGGLMMPFPQFLGIAKSVTNHAIVFEEATIFLSNKGDSEEIRYLLISKRHRNNTIFFTFHSLQQVPLNILSCCDLLILFHTGDNYSLVEKKFGRDGKIFSAFNLVKKLPKFKKVYVPLR